MSVNPPTLDREYARRPRILLGHPYWGRGGAEVVAMWILEALSKTCEIDMVTRNGWDLQELHNCAGTSFSGDQIGIIRLPAHLLFRQTIGGALWDGLFRRYCRHIAPNYDLCITASRIIDWGVPAIHFLSDVAWNHELQGRFQTPEVVARRGLVRRYYWGLSALLAGKSKHDPSQHDLFIANSQWTAGISAKYCAIAPIVIYPPVFGAPDQAQTFKAENSFLCLGRISPEKQIERVFCILDEVRSLGFEIRLHLAGNSDDAAYLRQIRRLCDARKDWVVFHGPVYGVDKTALMQRCRYGISACEREAFGIATAEMVKSGIIPFVPEDGAQSEIVQSQALIYRDRDEAIAKIVAVLKSQASEECLRAELLKRAAAFDPKKFIEAVQDVVQKRLKEINIG